MASPPHDTPAIRGKFLGYKWKCRERGLEASEVREKRRWRTTKNKTEMAVEMGTDPLENETCRARGPQYVVRGQSVYGPTHGRRPWPKKIDKTQRQELDCEAFSGCVLLPGEPCPILSSSPSEQRIRDRRARLLPPRKIASLQLQSPPEVRPAPPFPENNGMASIGS